MGQLGMICVDGSYNLHYRPNDLRQQSSQFLQLHSQNFLLQNNDFLFYFTNQ